MSKVVLITGGTRGIGRALVDLYLEKGFFVATFSSQRDNTEALRAAYPDEKRLYVDTFTITDQVASRNFAAEVVEKFGQIDLYIFNSGICQDKSFSKMTADQWQNVVTVNLTAAFDLTQSVFLQMKKQPGIQKIFFMTSLAGISGAFGQANYAASKGALIALSKTLALEGANYGIEVNAISPAALTEMTAPVIEGLRRQCEVNEHPFPKAWQIGSVKEVATSLYRLGNMKQTGSGQIFALNGENIEIYQPAVKIPFEIGD